MERIDNCVKFNPDDFTDCLRALQALVPGVSITVNVTTEVEPTTSVPQLRTQRENITNMLGHAIHALHKDSIKTTYTTIETMRN